MVTPFNAALSAYGAASNLITGNGTTFPGSPAGGNASTISPLGGTQGTNFADLLANSVQGVVDTGNRSDKLALDMVNGKANVVDVVTAISETEIAMESMVTVRDRVISAYEEIMRMPI